MQAQQGRGGCNNRVSPIYCKQCCGILYLYNDQTAIQVMKELDVNLLDVWETTYIGEQWHVNGDAQHYCIVFG